MLREMPLPSDFPRMKRVRYVLLLVVASPLVAGGWSLWHVLYKPSPMDSLMERARLPQYDPKGHHRLEYANRPIEASLRLGLNLPWATMKWYGPGNIWLSMVETELEVDMGGVREPVEVDGVRGWLTRLGTGDFWELEETEVRDAQYREWRYDRTIYTSLLVARRDGSGPWGDAIALQWNRDDIHYLLVAQDWKPTAQDELLKMANSMEREDLPFPPQPYR